MHIFISYSHQDAAFVNRLTQDLQRQQIDVWIDQQGIQGGEAWRKAIVEGINQCDAFLIVLSPDAAASRNVTKELSIADERGKRIFPVICEPCTIPAELEYQLAGLQWVDFTALGYDAAFGKLLQALNVPQKAAPQPPPTIPPQPQPQPIPPTAPGAWIIGRWQMQFQNPMTGNNGYGEFIFNGDGSFYAQQTTPMGVYQVSARWQWMNPQVVGVQGLYASTLMPYNQMPYSLAVQIMNVGPGNFAGVSQTGDQIFCQRLA
jgi:hypothetical protein